MLLHLSFASLFAWYKTDFEPELDAPMYYSLQTLARIGDGRYVPKNGSVAAVITILEAYASVIWFIYSFHAR